MSKAKKFEKLQKKAVRAAARADRFSAKHGGSRFVAKATTLALVEQNFQDNWDWFAGQITANDPQDVGSLGRFQEGQRLCGEGLQTCDRIRTPGGTPRQMPAPTLIPQMPTSSARAAARRVRAAAAESEPEKPTPTAAQLDTARRLGLTEQQTEAAFAATTAASRPEAHPDGPTFDQLRWAKMQGWSADQVANAFGKTKADVEARNLARNQRPN
jgi:hypothetical protein